MSAMASGSNAVTMSDEVEEEIQVLKSIFDVDYADGPSVWNCPSFSINCRPANIPNRNEDTELFVLIKFTLTKTYPRTVPTVKIENSKGITKKELAELDGLLQSTCKAHIGSVMCYDVASACISYLETKVPKSGNLYEDMISRQIRERDAFQAIVSSRPDCATQVVNSLKVDTAPVGDNLRQHMPRHPSRTSEYSESDSEDELIHVGNQDLPKLGNPGREFSDDIATSAKVDSSDEESEDADEESSDDDDSSSEDSSSDESEKEVSPPGQEPIEIKSRYKDEFEQMSLLGKGAFGEVWSCQNNLDTRVYAVKKIIINSSNAVMNAKIRREVTTISHLWHKHIVRYYAAWVESLTDEDELDSKLENSEDSLFASNSEFLSSKQFSWTGENMDDDSEDEDDYSDPEQMKANPAARNSAKQVLYIQMEFCQTTLRALLDEDNVWNQLNETIRLLRQVSLLHHLI
jgi:hypothetical protein